MRKKIPLLPIIAMMVCMVAAFAWTSYGNRQRLDELKTKYEQSRVQLAQAQNEQAALQETMDLAETDAFVENQARTQYGYMKPDEIRFVITNPETLYAGEAE